MGSALDFAPGNRRAAEERALYMPACTRQGRDSPCKGFDRLGTVDRVISVCLALGVMLIGIMATITYSSDRMPPVALEKYDGAQKKAAEEFRRLTALQGVG